MIKSPFLVTEHFTSPAVCETIIKQLGLSTPSIDRDGNPLRYDHKIAEPNLVEHLKSALTDLIPEINDRYNAVVDNIEVPVFNQYFENPNKPCELHGCENSKLLRKKWVKVKDIDLVGYLWLKDFNSGVPLDPRYELYGGKLEFAAYNFSIVPQRGTLLLFPAGPHFITAISPVLVGSLEQIKFGIKLKAKDGGMWMYQPQNFPGTYAEWFEAEEAKNG